MAGREISASRIGFPTNGASIDSAKLNAPCGTAT